VDKISFSTKISAKKKYRHRKNSGFDKITVEIKVARYQAQKKYWHCKNSGFDQITVEINGALSSAEKISASQK
jgi:hypothetical protein